jgi:hypothetical protein
MREESESLLQKKYRPPRPIGVKGGCSPQNNLANLRSYYPSFTDVATKFLK